MILTHVWQKPGWPEVHSGMVARSNFPWVRRQVEGGSAIHFSRVLVLPPEADRDRESFAKYCPRSNVTVPLFSKGKVFGALAFSGLEEEHFWTEAEPAEIQLVAGVFAHILGQVRAQEHLADLRPAEATRQGNASAKSIPHGSQADQTGDDNSREKDAEGREERGQHPRGSVHGIDIPEAHGSQ
jgi:hypothetical protein